MKEKAKNWDVLAELDKICEKYNSPKISEELRNELKESK